MTAYRGDGSREEDGSEATTTFESILADGSHGIRDADGSEAGTTRESIFPYTGHGIGISVECYRRWDDQRTCRFSVTRPRIGGRTARVCYFNGTVGRRDNIVVQCLSSGSHCTKIESSADKTTDQQN